MFIVLFQKNFLNKIMVKKINKIGIFTSGGDCAGLNAIINAVVRSATRQGIEVYGIHNGTEGLYYPNLDYTKLSEDDFRVQYSAMRTGGTMLGSVNRDKKLEPEALKEAFTKGVKALGLDSLIVVGGDGSAMIVAGLVEGTDINVITIPKTIDNDTPVTDYSIGFDTARNVCMEALDKLQTTAFSHHRIMIVEVMGRDAGHLALNTAIAGGADFCLIPEMKYSYADIKARLEEMRKQGVEYTLMVVSEGCKTEEGNTVTVNKGTVECYTGFGNYLSKKLDADGFLNRTTVLGHLQRGGMPTAYDRITASMFGTHAVDLLLSGKTNRLVMLKDGKVSDIDLFEAVKFGNRPVERDSELLDTAKKLGIYVGTEYIGDQK